MAEVLHQFPVEQGPYPIAPPETEMFPGGPGYMPPQGFDAQFESQFTPPTIPERLAALPHEGFASEEQRRQLIHEVDIIGLPVDNVNFLARLDEPQGPDGRHTLGSVDLAGEHAGRLSVYEFLYTLPPEARPGLLAHEMKHITTVFLPGNADMHGGEAARAEAEQRVADIAWQSLETEEYLTEYQSYLAEQYKDYKISFFEFAMETEAELGKLAMVDRRKLYDVEAQQAAAIEAKKLAGTMPANVEPVRLVSYSTPEGSVVVDGIDIQLMNLLKGSKGINTFGEYISHLKSIKQRFYSPEKWEKAARRWDTMIIDQGFGWFMEMERRLKEEQRTARDREQARRDEERAKKKSKATRVGPWLGDLALATP